MDSPLNLCTNTNLQSLLKCSFCEKFLSVPPIYQQDSGSICGRCKWAIKTETPQLTRQILYESLAQFLIFPCSNVSSGCKAQLKWAEVEQHENTCPLRKINCPFNNEDIFQTEKCKWTGAGPGLNEHLENCHGDKIQKLPCIIFTELETSCMYLTKLLKQLMIVTIKRESPGKFSCLVMVNGTITDCDGYRFQLEFSDGNKKNSVVLRRSRLADAIAFDQNLINLDKAIVVDIDVMKSLLKNSNTILGRFGIVKKGKQDANDEKSVDDNILRELECSVCNEYMIPPMMMCVAGHSFCNRCKEKMDKCPTCRKPFHKGRNYALEKISSCIDYPCTYRQAGCSVACSSEKIKEHEENCSFSGPQCFLCSTKKINLLQHLEESHGDSRIAAGDVSVLNISYGEDLIKSYAISSGNGIFRLLVWYNGAITFCLHQVGVEDSSYTYEVEVFYAADPSQRIVMGRQCPPLTTFTVEQWCKSVYLSEDMVQRFVSGDNLIYFKVHLKMLD